MFAHWRRADANETKIYTRRCWVVGYVVYTTAPVFQRRRNRCRITFGLHPCVSRHWASVNAAVCTARGGASCLSIFLKIFATSWLVGPTVGTFEVCFYSRKRHAAIFVILMCTESFDTYENAWTIAGNTQ